MRRAAVALALALSLTGCYTEDDGPPTQPSLTTVPVPDVPALPAPPPRVGDDEALCWRAVAPFQERAAEYGSTIVCQPPFVGEATGVAGMTSPGLISVMAWPGVAFSYYQEVAAHELGHAWTDAHFTEHDRQHAAVIMGWAEYDNEQYADVFAYALGFWADYGDGWRHAGGPPSDLQLKQLRYVGLLP